jgi:hypothetical protein
VTPEFYDPEEAVKLVCDAHAIMGEFLPDPDEEAAMVDAELRDALLCRDGVAWLRHLDEMRRRERFYSRATKMWEQSQSAQLLRNMDRLRENTAAIRSVCRGEFEKRRIGDADK